MKKVFIISVVIILSTLFYTCAAAPGTTTNPGGGGNPVVLPPGIYVATNGNDTNAGTSPAAAMLTIQYAISNAVTNGYTNVYVAAGIYSNGAGLLTTNLTGLTNSGIWISNSNIWLIGGWDSAFQARTGKSELEGNQAVQHVISMGLQSDYIANVIFDGFVVRGGKADSFPACGGGIYIRNGSIIITNTVISNNTANSWGGGICYEDSFNCLLFADIISNYCGGYGGAIFLNNCSSMLIDSSITRNVSGSYGGGEFINSASSFITQYGQVISNKANGNYGGGIFLDCSSSLIQAQVSWNQSANSGGGMMINGTAHDITISGTISYNTAPTKGGGIAIDGARNILTNLVIANNTANQGGGLSLSQWSVQNQIFAEFSSNRAVYDGGGIYALTGASNTIQSTLLGNTANQAGGIYIFRGSNFTVRGTFNGNSATNGNGGGIHVNSCLNILITAEFYNNCGTNTSGCYGGAIDLNYSTNVSILNSVFTNNWSIGPYPYDNSVICLDWQNANVMISNCTIGGSTHRNGITGNYAIAENTEHTGHVLMDNTFLSADLANLYSDNYGSPVIANNNDTWTNINSTNYSDAAIASGNKRVNPVFQLISGTINLPGSFSGKSFFIGVDPNSDPNDPTYGPYTNFTLGASTTVNYTLDFVTNGTWYLYALIDMDNDTNVSTNDYFGYFGGTGKTAPGSPNATVSTNQTNFNITLLELY